MTPKKKPLSIYPDDELRERIEQLADRERRSVNAQVLLLLENHPDLTRPVLPIESHAVVGDKIIDMHTHEEIGQLRVFRPTTCHHGKDIYTFCEICDA